MTAPQTEQSTQPRPNRGDELDLEIEALANGGRGIARHNGYVVFVPGAVPGDQVRVALTKRKRSYGEGRVLEITKPSSDRIPDRCIHGGETCPGSTWQGLPYELQLEHKAAQVEDALRRIGKLADFEIEPIEPAVDQWRYRNKTEYSFGETPEGDVGCGFHARGRWDVTVDIDDCLLASERNNEARNAVRDWARENKISPFDPHTRQGALRNLVVRESRSTGRVQTRLVTTVDEDIPQPPTDLHTVIERNAGSTDGPTGALGAEYIEEELGDLHFRISHSAFFQTNTEMAERLYGVARSYAALSGKERLFDLYCGIGTIGLSMARDAGEVWGIESVEQAVIDAEANAELNNIENAQFRAADARLGIRPLIEEAGKPDVIVIDPPRAGLSAKVVRRVIECEAPRIVYVSCNPTTLAPNAAQLVEAGYKLKRVRPVDMFPQTPHIECVALLER